MTARRFSSMARRGPAAIKAFSLNACKLTADRTAFDLKQDLNRTIWMLEIFVTDRQETFTFSKRFLIKIKEIHQHFIVITHFSQFKMSVTVSPLPTEEL